MAPIRKKLPMDQERRAERSEKDQIRRNTQNAGELNRNEERITPKGKEENLQRKVSNQTTPISERPDIAAEKWGSQKNQTTGSNVPGSEIADRQNQQSQEWQSSQDLYPKNSKSNPVSDIHHPGQHHTGFERNRPNQMYTGNSEKSGQQYSEDRNSPQRSDRELKQSKKELPDKSDGSMLSAKERRAQQRSLNAPDTRQQRETDQASGSSRKPEQKKPDKTDGEDC